MSNNGQVYDLRGAIRAETATSRSAQAQVPRRAPAVPGRPDRRQAVRRHHDRGHHRATFYAHYRDKAELLREACSELIGELTERATALAPYDTPIYTGAPIVEIFRHAGEHRDLYRLVLSGEGGATPRTDMIAALRDSVANVFSGLANRLGREPRVPS